MSQRINGLSDVAESYTGILCDVWGVLHNGRETFEAAANALSKFRHQGGRVVLITNSPRPRNGVITQLTEMGVGRDVYDEIVTSGDATRVLIANAEGPVFHLGPTRDLPLFDGLDVELASSEDSKTIVCTGLLEDETEVPEDYRARLAPLVERDMPMICANPDLVVHRGEKLIFCAGALAQLYSQLGGQTYVAGKPHKPIYDLSLDKMNCAAGENVSKSEIIVIGDGLPTDVAGAHANGFDLLYISAGIHSGEYGGMDHPDETALADFLTKNDAKPNVWMPRLTWGES